MRLIDVVARSGRNLRSAKIRTILTALAIAVGGFTLAITLAAGNGLRNYTDKLVATNFDPSEILIGRDPEFSNTGAPKSEPKEYDESVGSMQLGGGQGNLQLKQVTKEDVEQIKSEPYVESVRESFQINLRYITREGQKKYTVSGESYNPGQKPEIKAGSFPAGRDIEKGTVFIPEGYVSVLGFKNNEEALGKTIQVMAEKPFSEADAQSLLMQAQSGNIPAQPPKNEQKTVSLKIAGVTKRPSTSFAVGTLPVLLNSQDGRDLYDFTTEGTENYEKYLLVYARIKDGADEAKTAEAKRDLESKGYFVQTSKDIQKTITQFVNILQIMVGVFGIITLIASVFGIINTQYISVLERTREIGLMKALGMRSRDVRRLFMIEATWIGFLGGAIGSLLGIAAAALLNPWITKKLELGSGNNLFVFQAWQIAVMILALMVVATVAGYLPARKAAKLDPIEALRRE